jgi:hypothetical protein
VHRGRHPVGVQGRVLVSKLRVMKLWVPRLRVMKLWVPRLGVVALRAGQQAIPQSEC